MSHRRIERTCQACGCSFQARAFDVRRGLARMCSRRCAGKRPKTSPKEEASHPPAEASHPAPEEQPRDEPGYDPESVFFRLRHRWGRYE